MKNVRLVKYRFFRGGLFVLFSAALLFSSGASAQISVVSSQTNSNAATATISINKPNNLQAGDLMIANITNRGTASDPTTLPSGWTKVTSYGLATAGRYAYIAYKVAVTADVTASAFSFGWGTTAQTGIAGGITAFRGVNTTTNGGIEATGTAVADQTTGPISPAQITTLTNNAMVLFLGQISGTGITFTTGNWTVGGINMTAGYTVYSTVEPSAGLAYLVQATAGATGAGSKAISGDARWGGVLLALKPLPIPVISSALTSSSTYGTPSSYIITASNSPTSFNATGLPTGMSVNTSTGAITVGATTAAGTYNITISATNSQGTDSKTISHTVNTAPLTITGISISNKIYDGNTNASISGTAAYSGLQNGEIFSVTGTPSASFADPNVGTGKPVTVTGYTAPSSNYSITQPGGLTADITADSFTAIAVNDTIRINTNCFVNNNVVETNVLVNDTDPDNNLDRSSVLLVNPANPAQTGTSYTVAGTGQWTTNGTTVSFIAASGFIGRAEISYRVCDSTNNCSAARIVLELGDLDNRGCFPGSRWDVASSDTVFAIASGTGCRNPTFILGVPDYNPEDTMTYATLSAINNNVVLDFGPATITTSTHDSIRVFWASDVSASNSVIKLEYSLNNNNYSTWRNDTSNTSAEASFPVPLNGVRFVRITYVSGAKPRIDGAQGENWSCIVYSTDAEDDNIVVREDIPTQINLLENDIVAGSTPTTLNIISQPRQGRLSINTDNTVTYLNNTDFPGGNIDAYDTFTYRICNSFGQCASARAYITIINDKCNQSGSYRPLGSNSINITIPGINATMIDSYIKKDKQDENQGVATTLEIGKSKGERRGLFKFNVRLVRDSIANRMPAGTNWPDAAINSAKFSIYKKGGDGVNLNLSAHSISITNLASWTEGTGGNNTGVTWKRKNISATNFAWTNLGGDFVLTPVSAIVASSVNGFKTFELKNLVQSWMLSELDTFGILVRQNSSVLVDKRHQYQSSDVSAATTTTPKLEISISAPLSCTGIPNRAPLANPDYATIGTEDSVTLSPLLNDADPDNNNIILGTTSQLNTIKGTVRTAGSVVIYKPNFSLTIPRTDTLLYRTSDGLLLDSAFIFINISFRTNAGNDRNICSSKDTLKLSGKITGNLTSCQWKTNGSGQFSNSTVTNPVYTLSNADRNLSTLSFILNSTSPGSGCGAIVDTVNFAIEKQPAVNAGGPDSVCSSTPPSAITLTGSSLTNASNGTWSIISGTGSLSSTAAQPNPATVSFTPAGGFTGNVQLKLKSNSTANCQADSATRNLYIKPKLQILSDPSSRSICQGENDTLRVIANIPSSTFQWFSSNNNGSSWTSMSDGVGYSGTSTASLICSAPPLTNGILQFKVRVSNPVACLSPAESNPVSLRFKNLWLGNSNTNWENNLNWSDQSLPGTGCPEICILGNRPNQPVISNTITLGNIRILENGILTVNSMLRISGSINTEGTGKINATEGTIELFGNSAAQYISGSNFLNRKIRNLVISNTAGVNISDSAGNTLNISGKLSFGSVNNSILNSGNNLVLLSDSGRTAAVADITNNGANTGNAIIGNVTVERYITKARKWQFLAIPTNTTQSFKQAWMEGADSISQNPRPGYGTIITDNRSDWRSRGFDGFSPGGPSVKIYNPASGLYNPIPHTDSAIGTKYGYMAFIRGDRTATSANTVRNSTVLRTTGTLKQGLQTAIPIPDTSFVAIGNPFASTIDMGKIVKASCENYVWIWDPALTTGYGVGAYQTFFGFLQQGIYYYIPTPGGGSYPQQTGPPIPFNQIQSGQAFFVRGRDSFSFNNQYVQIRESDKMSDSNRLVMRPMQLSLGYIRSNLYSLANNPPELADGVSVFLSADLNNTSGQDDAKKMRNNNINVSINKNGNHFAVEGRSSLKERDTFFLHMTGLGRGDFEWNVEMHNMNLPGRFGWLIDNFTKSRTRLDLQGITTYRFSTDADPASAATDRFLIVFRQPPVKLLEFTDVSGIRINDRITVAWNVQNENGDWKYEIERADRGNEFALLDENRQKATGQGMSEYFFSDINPLTGDNIYRIKAMDAIGNVVYSEKITVGEISKTDFVSISPNPVKGKNIRLYFSTQPAGNYQIEVIDNAGALILKGSYKLMPGSRELRLPLAKNTAAGVYFVKISEANKKLNTVQKIIIE